MPGVIVALIILIIVALLIAVSCVKIVPQATACVVERLGGYLATWSVGIHFKAPFIDRVAKRVVLKEQVVDFPPQPVITKDNVTMRIDTVVFYQITDDVTKCCRCQVLDRHNRILNAVCVELRVRDLEEHDRIDLHGDVILCDHRLRSEVNDLLF